MFRRNIQYAYLGRKNEAPVIGHIVSGRTQSVPVECRADKVTVAEQNSGRAVPRLHHGRVIVIEIPALFGHKLVMFPGLRNRDHDCQRQIHAVHVQKFERIVENRGIGAGFVDDRENSVYVLFHVRAVHGLLAGEHAVHIAADCIDFAVVRDHTVRVRAVPRRRCIR